MIKCMACGNFAEPPARACPVCRAHFTPTELEIRLEEENIRAAIKSRDYERAVQGYRHLATRGVVSAAVEYARILEEGELLPRDLDLAVKYFSFAARERDPYGAYRYSRLLSRESDAAAVFFLEYAAYLGCKDSYPAVAQHYSSVGEEELASYYYALSAELDDTASIVTMARRYYDGVGVAPSAECARWYLDKLPMPPFHAVKLAYKLLRVKPREPVLTLPASHGAILPRLAAEALRLGFDHAYCHLVELISESDVNMLYTLGRLYAEGVGCEASARRAISALERAAAHGVSMAYKYLGDLYLEGQLVDRDIMRALECYRSAADLGMGCAYEIMGDILYDGRLLRCDIRAAIELYELAAAEGESSAEKKADRLKREREGLFAKGTEMLSGKAEEGFRLIAISVGMGYIHAYKALAECYLFGKGTGRDRRRAHHWYSVAYEEGAPGAAFELALCYSQGIGVPFDFKRAIELLKEASAAGDMRAESEIKRLLENKRRHMADKLFSAAMRLIYQKKTEPARRMLEYLQKLGYAKGIYTLGCMHEFGLGAQTNREYAFSLYEIAYSLKFRDPRQSYKLRVLKMLR